nr:MAG TPA: protein of unknown function DUF3988 [Caudoviricetes sp.]
MAEGIDKKITDLATAWNGYKGSRVEEFLKEYLSKLDGAKFGFVNIESGENSLQTIRFFRDEQAYADWFADRTANADRVLGEFSLYSNKPVESYTMRAIITRYPAANMARGAQNAVSLAYNCYWGDNPADRDTQDGTATVEVNGTAVPELTRQLKASGTATANVYTFELGEHLTAETNEVKLRVTNAHGAEKIFTFNVNTYSLTLEFDSAYDESKVQASSWTLRVNCQGVPATVYCRVQDGGHFDTYTKSIANSSGEFVIDEQNRYAGGAHAITLWAENKELGLRTPDLTTTYIKASAGGVGTAAICLGKGIPTEARQFSVVKLPYYFYLPDEDAGSTATVKVELLYNGGAQVRQLGTQQVTLAPDKSSGLQSVNVALDDSQFLPEVTVRISVGPLSAECKVKVQGLGVTLAPAAECKVYIPMRGRANGDESAQNIVATYRGRQTARLVRSDNFRLDENNGFIDGQGMTIRAGKNVTLKDFLPFGSDFGANGSKQGRTIELEFESGICSDENAVIVDCMDGGTGFRVYANRVELGCATGNVITYYPEQSRVRLGVVIDGTTTHTRNNLGGGSVAEKDVNLAYLYMNGVIVRMFDYATASWKQGAPKELVIGSPQAEVKLYSIRMYDKALNFAQMVGNYAYDTPDIEDVTDREGRFVRFGKVSIARRNDILNSVGDIHNPDEIVSYNKVRRALPETPIAVWDIEDLPYNKNNPNVPITATEFINPQWDKARDGWAGVPFKVGPHAFNADGTSSNGYPLPYKNWAEIFETFSGDPVTLTLDPGHSDEQSTSYSITRGVAEGEKEMVHKVNFASSEGIFNVLAMNLFQEILLGCARNDMDLYTSFQRAQAMQGKEVTFRKSLSGLSEIGFRKTAATSAKEPTFLSIYNMINNKYSASFMGFPKKDHTKAQIWEIDENVNFFNREMTLHELLANGTVRQSNGTDSAGPMYYARVPKKSPTNKKNKFGQVKSATDDIEAANRELAVILRFHNWVVSCNPHLPERYKAEHGEYKLLDQTVTYNGVKYDRDTPAYRRARFVNTYRDYLVKDDVLFYIVFCVFFLGMDSLDKNMSIAFDDIELNPDGSVKVAHARLFLRDTDSQSLFNNSGALFYKYWAEWNDAYNPTTGKTQPIAGETYDNDNHAWLPKMDEGYSPVFNGRLSGLIDLVWQCWGDDLAAMYKSMRDNGLESSNIFRRYTDFWKQWCENLYNADAMGYANTGHFTKAYGDKLMLMLYFLLKRSRYMDSKFCCGASVVNNLRMRLYEQGKGLAIKHYSPLYASVQWGANNFTTERNIDGGYALIPFGFTNPQNATFDIDDADMITDIKTFTRRVGGQVTYSGLEGLGDFEFDANMQLLRRLEELVMDYAAQRPNTRERGTAFDLSKCVMLRRVIVRNVKNLAKVIQLGSGVLQEVDFTGTPVKGVVVPENGTLTRLVLPDTIEELTLRGLDALEPGGLKLGGLANVKKFRYSACRKLNGFDILQRIYTAGAKPTDIEMDGLNETLASLDTLDLLAEAGAKLSGRITLRGITPDFRTKLRYVQAWGDVDNPRNPLHIVYERIPVNSVTISGDIYVQEAGVAWLNISPDNVRANSVRAIEWSMAANPYATLDARTGRMAVTRVGSDETAKAQVTVTVTVDDGRQLTATETVYFYKRAPQVGDIVYADGSWSDKHNKNKTPIGVCFYISADGKDRRMMGLTRLNSFNTSWGTSGNYIDRLAKLASEPARDISVVRGMKKNWPTEIADDWMTLEEPLLDYPRGSKIPYGMYNTLCIIRQRNDILQDENYKLDVPQASAGVSEFEDVKRCALKYFNENQIYVYYVPASLSYAYSPAVLKGETLSNQFAPHKWHLPSAAEAKAILVSISNDYTSDRNFLKAAVSYGLIEQLVIDGSVYVKSLETSQETSAQERLVGVEWTVRGWVKWGVCTYVFPTCNF